jgi:hypothetical protein
VDDREPDPSRWTLRSRLQAAASTSPMSRLIPLCLALAVAVIAHGDHSFDLSDENDISMSYAERHVHASPHSYTIQADISQMHTEHHIDSFDLESFFKLHDLNLDGLWDEPEIQAVYGLHHHSVKEKIPQDALIEGRTQVVVDKVLSRLDKNGDSPYLTGI